MDLFDLVAKITLDSSEYEKGLSESAEKAGGFGSKVGTVMKGAAIGVTAVTTATAALGGAFVKATGGVAEYGDHIDKMSQKMGLSAEKYQEWDAILQHSGTSIDTMKAGMKTLANAVENGNDAFERIGLTQQQIANMSQEELFEATISGLQNVEDVTERTYLAGQLLGRGATELGALLNTSAEDTEKMRQRVHELGGVMSDDAVKASARYTDSLQDMRTAMEGAKRNILSSFLPSVADAMDGIANLFSGDSEEGLGQIKEGVSSFIETLSEAIPKIIEVGVPIIQALTEAIVQNLPALMEAGIKAVGTLITGIVQALPSLIKVLVQQMPMIVTTLAKALISAGGQFLSVGKQLISKLSSGISSAFIKLVSKVKGLAKKIPSAIKSGVGSLVSIGKNLIEGLWSGIKAKFDSVIAKVKALAAKLPAAVKKVLGISSPSKVFAELGQWIPEGLALGIERNLSPVEDASDAMVGATAITPSYDSGLIGTTQGEFGRIVAILQEWLPQMANIDMVLDTGALVGQLARPIDNSLGTMQKNRRRGNA